MLLKELGEEETYYYHPDHLGSVSVVSNHKGEPYERVEYLPLGELWIEETDPATSYIPFRFTSKEYDEETGLYYYGARYYEPRLSRWMSADPAGFALINPMGEDGKPVPDGWPEGFGPGPRVGMRPGYSVIEATNWYSYTSNNPVLYVDPTGMEEEVASAGLWDQLLDVLSNRYEAVFGDEMAHIGDEKSHIRAFGGEAKAVMDLPAGDLYASAEAAVIDSDFDVEAKTQDGQWGVGLEGGGDVWKANANVGAKDFTLKGGAFAGVLEGELGVTFRTFGYEVGVILSGSLGSIGMEGKLGKEGFKAKAAFLMGAGIEIDLKGMNQ